MSKSQRADSVDPSRNEEYVTYWPAVAGAMVVVLAFAVVPALVYWHQTSDELADGRDAASVRRHRPSRMKNRPSTVAKPDVSPQDLASQAPVVRRQELYKQIGRIAADAAASVKSTVRRTTIAVPDFVGRFDVMIGEIEKLVETRRLEQDLENSLPVLTEKEYLEDLRVHMYELDFNTINQLTMTYLKESSTRRQSSSRGTTGATFDSNGRGVFDSAKHHGDPVLTRLLTLRDKPELRGIPFRTETNCVADPGQAKVTQQLSSGFRRGQSRITRSRSSNSQSEYRIIEQQQKLAAGMTHQVTSLGKVAVPVMVQMLQGENEIFRLALVDQLRAIKSTDAGIALVQRAVFDLSPHVRHAAIGALQERQGDQYRRTLLKYMRYPWPAAANHASIALVELDQSEVTKDLVDLLDKPDPRAPFETAGGKWSVREIVRVNHLKNCLLCHAPSTSRRDLVRAPVPLPNQPLPVVYYASSRGALVRADVTYLKQDFAVRHPVQNHGKWPAMQRFDYFVRERPSDKHESAAWAKRNPAASPYRKAALFALRKLTGKDVGNDSKAWRRLLDDG